MKLNSSNEPADIYYINCSKFPITSIELVDNTYLWLASANMVYVINERSVIHTIYFLFLLNYHNLFKILVNFRNLLNESKFEVSANQYDAILTVNSSEHGVWLSIRGSSVVHLYDKRTYACKLLFDSRNNQYLNIEKVWKT